LQYASLIFQYDPEELLYPFSSFSDDTTTTTTS
jgi:hypothetical protein